MLRAIAAALVVAVLIAALTAFDLNIQGITSVVLYGATHDYGWGTALAWYLIVGYFVAAALYVVGAFRWGLGE